MLRAAAFAALAALSPHLGATSAPPVRDVADRGLPPGYLVEYLAGVVVILLVLGGLAWLARRMQGRYPQARDVLRIEASLPLGGKERLVVVNVEGERLLLGVGAGGVRTLRRLGQREVKPSAALADTGWLGRTLRREAH